MIIAFCGDRYGHKVILSHILDLRDKANSSGRALQWQHNLLPAPKRPGGFRPRSRHYERSEAILFSLRNFIVISNQNRVNDFPRKAKIFHYQQVAYRFCLNSPSMLHVEHFKNFLSFTQP
jgi:hypothetical protein